ncbi:MAG: fumarate hydratase, partial [Pseudomonadota bacterium]
MPREVRLSTTPSAEAVADLGLGDIVYLDGLMYTAREGVY